MLHIQSFLREGGTPESLLDKYKVTSSRHDKYNNLVLFKYDMVDSPMGEPIVQECRGIILDEANDWAIVSRPFDKFFNLGEGHAKPIDWKTAKVFEKVDGSLATLYVYDGAWHMATSGSADAGGNVGLAGFTFEELFWRVYHEVALAKVMDPEENHHILPPLDCNICFFFELTSLYNKIVVKHDKANLTLLGARDLTTQRELTVEEAHQFFPDFDRVKEFPLGSFEECIATFEHMSPLAQEGYVVCDANFNRVKVKHPGYVALHHMRDGLSSKRALIEVVRSGEIDEVVVAFPEYETLLMEAKGRLDTLVSELETSYDAIKHIENQKSFALEAVKTRCPSALFAFRAKKVSSVRKFLASSLPIDSVMKLLNYKTNGE